MNTLTDYQDCCANIMTYLPPRDIINVQYCSKSLFASGQIAKRQVVSFTLEEQIIDRGCKYMTEPQALIKYLNQFPNVTSIIVQGFTRCRRQLFNDVMRFTKMSGKITRVVLLFDEMIDEDTEPIIDLKHIFPRITDITIATLFEPTVAEHKLRIKYDHIENCTVARTIIKTNSYDLMRFQLAEIIKAYPALNIPEFKQGKAVMETCCEQLGWMMQYISCLRSEQHNNFKLPSDLLIFHPLINFDINQQLPIKLNRFGHYMTMYAPHYAIFAVGDLMKMQSSDEQYLDRVTYAKAFVKECIDRGYKDEKSLMEAAYLADRSAATRNKEAYDLPEWKEFVQNTYEKARLKRAFNCTTELDSIVNYNYF